MAKQKARLPVNPTPKEQSHYNAVLLEEVRSQMNTVIETMEVNHTQLNEKIDGVEMRLTDRIEIVETVVKRNSAKLQEHDQRFDRLETDVKEIKAKLDDVAGKVDRHDEVITFLKSAATQN